MSNDHKDCWENRDLQLSDLGAVFLCEQGWSREWEGTQQPSSLSSWQLGVPQCWPHREKEEKRPLGEKFYSNQPLLLFSPFSKSAHHSSLMHN